MEKEVEKQNVILKNLLKVMVELLPRHSPDCYGWQVHPRNRGEYCNCKMSEIRKTMRDLE